MSVLDKPVHPTLDHLAQAVLSWEENGDERRLARWLGRELDEDGVPRRLAVPDWHRSLEILADARRRKGEWPGGCVETITRLIEATLRFSRPDGTPAMEQGPAGGRPSVWSSPEWARWFRGTGISRVLGWWSGGPSRRSEAVPPPLPTWSAPDRVLGVLRPDWLPGGDFVAVDHRDPGAPCRFELFGVGRTWLGPEWGEAVGPEVPSARPRRSRWITTASADLIEWTYRLGGLRITRSALLLRGRGLGLFGIQIEGTAGDRAVEPALRLAMPPGVAAGPIKGSRALALTQAAPRGRGGAQVLPIGLPCRPYPTDRGALTGAAGALSLTQPMAGRRCWLPLLVSWRAERQRKTPDWRVLTVSERSRAVGPDRAFATRVSWGRDETYVFYRSLAAPGRRAFLGHQTTARFLVATFDEDGDLHPILTIY